MAKNIEIFLHVNAVLHHTCLSIKKCGISKQKAVGSAENVGFNCEYASTCRFTMTVTICHFKWESETLCELIYEGFAAKCKTFMCQTLSVHFVYKYTLVCSTERFEVCQE